MKTNLIKKMVIIAIFVIAITLFSSFSYAASSITIAAGSTSVTVGSSTTLTIRANNVTGRINITSSNPGVIALSSSSEWVENGTVTIRATAKAAGNAYITVSSADTSDSTTGDPVNVSTGVNLISKEVVIDTRSSNNYLSLLTVEGYELSPAFDINTNNYTINVGYDVSSLNISGIPADTKSRTVVDGNLDLVAGENNVTITVTAENGYKRVYTITVIKEKNPDDVDATIESLVINNATLKNEFKSDIYEYMCEDITADIDKLEIELITKIPDLKYEIIGNDELKQGINHVVIKVTSRDGSVTKEYEIIVFKTDEVLALEEISPTMADVKGNTILTKIKEHKYKLIFSVSVVSLIAIIIVLINFLKKNKKECEEIEEQIKETIESKNTDLVENLQKDENILEEIQEKNEEVIEEQDEIIEKSNLDFQNLNEDYVEKETKVRKGKIISNTKKEKRNKKEVIENGDETKITLDLSRLNDKDDKDDK